MPTTSPRIFGKSRDRRRWARFREAVAATANPQLERGGSAGDAEPDADDAVTPGAATQCPGCKGVGITADGVCPRCEGKGVVGETESGILKESAGTLVSLAGFVNQRISKLREASGGEGPVYEVELIVEGPGNARDRVYYTAQALREAVASGVFRGQQAYANHPDAQEDASGERSLKELVGWYRNHRFKEQSGKGRVVADLVVIPGKQWFIDLLEAAIAAKSDGVDLCGISIDGGGIVEAGQIEGQTFNICRKITESPSADIVPRAGARGNVVRRLRESLARTDLPKPQGGPMKISDFQPKITETQVKLREALGKLTEQDASDEQVAAALSTLRESDESLADLAAQEIEPEVQFREAEGGGDAAKLAKEKAEIEVKLREAEEKVTELEGKNDASERALLAAAALREAEIPTDSARAQRLFGELVRYDSAEAMSAHLQARKADEEELMTRLRESIGVGAPSGVEGAPRLAPVPMQGGGADRLAELGIPVLPEPASAGA